MIIPFRGLPGTHGFTPRPVADVAITHDTTAHVVALCDTGALYNRFASWVADEIGLDVSAIEPEALGVGGQHLLARTAVLSLRVGEMEWEAPVSFCEPWPWSYQLLGQEGFFRWFEVTVRAADSELDITQIEG
ncbi:MAG: hypothetical protein ACR2JF_00940 [Iamia sp.]